MIEDTVVAIKRLTPDSDNADKEGYVVDLSLQSVKCQIQPVSAEESVIVDGVYGQTFLMFTTQSGIFSGDKVTVSGSGSTYRVKGVQDWSTTDLIPHFEMTLVKMEEE